MVDMPMPLTAHLTELRARLGVCVTAIAVGFGISYAFSDQIVAALQSPRVLVGEPVRVPLQMIAPAEAFLTYLKVSLLGSSRKSQDDFVIYHLHCTHVGCPVNWSPQAKRFFSPCHGGVFDPDGRVLAGPPPRPLDRYEGKVENGVLYAGPVYRVSNQLERVAS